VSAIATVRRRQRGEHEESYFVSMTDMMVGLVFVLMVMLVYYALQYRQTTAELTDTKVRRTELLQHLQARLKAEKVNVVIDTDAGVLRLPEDVLFDKGSDAVKPEGQLALAKVGQALVAELPCYTAATPPAGCAASHSGLESVFIEGHTDNDQMSGARDNWNLSADRAVNTYRSLMGQTPALNRFSNARLRPTDPQPLFGVSGYGPTRPVVAETSEDAKRRNRRIDVRFNMVTPSQAR
jgi:chemotaxis protein MotB